MARATGCLLGAACGLCQIRAEQAVASKDAYAALQREIGALLARDTRNAPAFSGEMAGAFRVLRVSA